MLIDSSTKAFIATHLNDDIRRLALAKAPDGVDLPFALQQIDGRQRAKTKLPALAANPDIVFPVHLSVEQCSSEATAIYKREILERLLCSPRLSREGKLIDLTGGFGIDFIHLSPLFNEAVYVERNVELCKIAELNFKTLGLKNTEVVNAEAESFLSGFPKASKPRKLEASEPIVFFIDPARRDKDGKRTFAISDCTPNVLALVPDILATSATLFLKLSPMLDWHKAVADLQAAGLSVLEVHIVSVKNECKELLIIARKPEYSGISEYSAPPFRLFCKNDDSITEIPAANKPQAERQPSPANPPANSPSANSPANPPTFLLLPNASIMKAGCWDFLAGRYPVSKADANSHIFFSDEEIAGFPGQSFRIQQIFSLNKKELRSALSGISRADISVRNFPLKAEELRRRLKLKDGGAHHIFATTIQGEHKLLLCLKP